MNSSAYPFHDGYLISISVAEGVVVLGLKQQDGALFTMTLQGVEALDVDGFREGNIILDLWSVSGKYPTSADLACMEVAEIMEVLFPGPHPSAAAQYHETHASFIAGRLDKVANGEAALVLLGPAYGAELFAYCASIELVPKPQSGVD